MSTPDPETQYSMSFTSGTLLYRESLVLAERFIELGDWTGVRSDAVKRNLLQMRTANASKRIVQEVISRLRLLTPEQLELLRTGDHQEKLYVLWLAVCKRYRFIREFAVEVLHAKYKREEPALTHVDYDIFYNAKAEWQPEVDNIAPSTRVKGRSVIFKMMREAGLLTDAQQIIPAILSFRLAQVIRSDTPALFAIYPAPLPRLKD